MSNGFIVRGDRWDLYSKHTYKVPTLLNMPGIRILQNIKGFKQNLIDGVSIAHSFYNVMEEIAKNFDCEVLVIVVIRFFYHFSGGDAACLKLGKQEKNIALDIKYLLGRF